jgi:hypothetical protein
MSVRRDNTDSVAVTDTQALLDDLKERGYKLTVGENGNLFTDPKGPAITPVIYWALQANYRKLVHLLSPPVTNGESESSRRRENSRSITITPEMKRLDDIRRRKYVGTDIATADEARKTAEWCTLCRASLTEQPVYYGRANVEAVRWRKWTQRREMTRRQQKVPLCAECFGPYAQNRELEKCDTCTREGWFCVAAGRPRFCSERCKSAYYNAIRNARSAEAREKTCEACSETFTATRSDQKTCSPACRQKAHRKRKKVAG